MSRPVTAGQLLAEEALIVCSRVLPICRHRPVLHPLGSSTYAIDQRTATMKVYSQTSAHNRNLHGSLSLTNKQKPDYSRNVPCL